MELTKFCPRCGKETDKLYGNKKKMCPDCYPDVNQLLEIPDTVTINICSICGRMRKHGNWVEEYTLQEQLAAKFEEFSEKGVETELQYWEEDKKMFVRVHAYKDEMKAEYDTELKIENQQCQTCSQFHGGFYKVKLQLRGDKDLENISNQIVDTAAEVTNEGRKNFLANVEQTDSGYDFYLSTEKIAGEILRMLKARHQLEVKRSYELMGEEDGQRVYRNVISVRIQD